MKLQVVIDALNWICGLGPMYDADHHVCYWYLSESTDQ